ncbi:hypothetical protein Pelo_18763 [Pelomyxa schiedti]|nr:hypothetical protein Pelo_18763 [Pelomyxa schiedti]
MDIQHDHLEKFVFIAEAALKSASKVSHTSHDFGVIRAGTLTQSIIQMNLSDGTIVPTDDDTRRGSSGSVGVLTPQVIQTRFRVVSTADGPIDSAANLSSSTTSYAPAGDGSAKGHNFTMCDRPDEVEFTLQHGGKYHLIVEAAVWPNMESWVPIPGCPFLVTATQDQVDISKSKIENLSTTLVLGQRLSLPIKLMNTGGQPVADVDLETCSQHVEWRVSVTPPTAAIVSIGCSSAKDTETGGDLRGVVVVDVQPKVVMDHVVVAVEGSFSSPRAASQPGSVVEKGCSSNNYNNKETVWQHISGSPFTLRGQFLVFDLTEPCVVPVVCFRTHGKYTCVPKCIAVSAANTNDWQRFPVNTAQQQQVHRWVRLDFESVHGAGGGAYVLVSGVKFWDN